MLFRDLERIASAKNQTNAGRNHEGLADSVSTVVMGRGSAMVVTISPSFATLHVERHPLASPVPQLDAGGTLA